jgi:alkylhydroperoxidase/carboxymuconolactone decarboxylase family protein YurZ
VGDVSDERAPNDRRARGLAVYHEVYGEDAPMVPSGDTTFFDLLVIEQQFAEVWSRRALPIPLRRLLTIGVLAATQRFDIVEFQFRRTLATGELTPEQVREAVIHLITYVGTPSSGGLHQAGERAIEAHAAGEPVGPSPSDG